MKRLIRQSEKRAGFTIVELLTVMSIIIILIGILVPSLNMVRRYASDVKQRAQFHSIEAALELFKNEFDEYPDSGYQDTAGLDEVDKQYPGATRLCEAMVGQDLLGFHPNSHFMADCTDGAATPVRLYDNPSGFLSTLSAADLQTNLQARKGPYLQLDKAHAFRLSDIYGEGKTWDLKSNLFVLCDEYARVKHKTTGKRIGMPILYYKANTSGTQHDPNDIPTPEGDQGNIYDYRDNDYLVGLGMPWDSPGSWGSNPKHPLHNTPKIFYITTKNENITITAGRPYRADSYILISAGFDGQYGTPDDIFNFVKE